MVDYFTLVLVIDKEGLGKLAVHEQIFRIKSSRHILFQNLDTDEKPFSSRQIGKNFCFTIFLSHDLLHKL